MKAAAAAVGGSRSPLVRLVAGSAAVAPVDRDLAAVLRTPVEALATEWELLRSAKPNV
jgi:hypothetical protein